MTVLVPFDGSSGSEAALTRAVRYGAALESDVLAVAMVPTGADVAQRRTRIHPGDDFAVEAAAAELRRKIDEATDEAEIRFADATARSPADGITEQIDRLAREVDASVVFLGADGDGTLEVSLDGDAAPFDVHVVRRPVET
jgi:nucleotide-binding universal stress UspA family protein